MTAPPHPNVPSTRAFAPMYPNAIIRYIHAQIAYHRTCLTQLDEQIANLRAAIVTTTLRSSSAPPRNAITLAKVDLTSREEQRRHRLSDLDYYTRRLAELTPSPPPPTHPHPPTPVGSSSPPSPPPTPSPP